MNALSTLQKYMEDKHEQITRLEQKLDRLPINLVQEAFPQGVWGTFWDFDFEFTLPMSVELLEQFKDFCDYQGFVVGTVSQQVWNAKDAGYFIDVRVTSDYPRVEFRVAFRSNREGTTCVIQQIGTEVKPVFEVVCGESAGSF